MLKLFIGKDPAEVKVFKFPAGESGVSYEYYPRTHVYNPHEKFSAKITLLWEGNDDLINLALLVDAIRRKEGEININLDIPYFPYCRQDRICNPGESLSVKVIASFINSLGFSRVYIIDPHSDVLGAVLDNMVQIDIKHKVHEALFTLEKGAATVALVSPDAGALKKVYGYASYGPLGTHVVRADKTRNTKTGKIAGTVVYSEHLGNTNLLVVDDLCDGGFTFTQLAPELRKITTGTVSLFVSHGIFTKGVDIVADVYDNVFVVNNMYGAHPKLKEI